MKNKRIIQLIFLVSFTFSVHLLQGQIAQEGIPYSMQSDLTWTDGGAVRLNDNIPTISLPAIDPAAIKKIQQSNKNEGGPFQFAYGFDVDIDVKQKARVDRLPAGLLYRLVIQSRSAKSLNFIFSSFKVSAGAKLFIYNANRKHIIGGFTANNNKASEILPTAPVTGDEIVIEYFEPYFTQVPGQVIIGKIGHDFTGINKTNRGYGDAGECMVNVNCSEGSDWQMEKRSVCLLIYESVFQCTGTLMNNTAHDARPYVLTANHCIDNEWAAFTTVAIFNYDSPGCWNANGPLNQSISGAELVANRIWSDFSLLELTTHPIPEYKPFYAGWDRSPSQSGGGVVIHHPKADVKKISTDNSSLSGSSANYWLVNNWAETLHGYGVLEEGSDGAALFNSEHRVIGQSDLYLAFTDDTCSDPDNVSGSFGKFSTSWDGGITADSRLRDWLDPNASGQTEIDGEKLCGPGVEANIYLGQTIETGDDYFFQSTNSITADNTIEAGATAKYEAGFVINLLPGFTSEYGSDFHGEIVPMDCLPGCYPIGVLGWTNYVCQGQEEFCIWAYNATNYSVHIQTIAGTTIFQDEGIVFGYPVCLWDPIYDDPTDYLATVTFWNETSEISESYILEVDICPESPEAGSSTTYEPNQMRSHQVAVYPNPADHSFTLEMVIEQAGLFNIDLLDVKGSLIKNIASEKIFDNGKIRKEVNIDELARGVYYLKIHSETSTQVEKIIVQ